ncbi:hypothetical protein AMECASPLE_012768 [Ameca splendens]|uniref:Uncharacterized protein n=1 Tax=Ameca splendens TaxID=208324 RepID=A0ABV0YNM9_9TELE
MKKNDLYVLLLDCRTDACSRGQLTVATFWSEIREGEEGYPSFPWSQHHALPSAVSPEVSYQGLTLTDHPQVCRGLTTRFVLLAYRRLSISSNPLESTWLPRKKQHEPHALNGYLNRGLSRGNVGLSRVLLRG